MPPKKSKKNSKPKQLPALEDIDTSVLSLKQLQDFCVRVNDEVEKVEWESRTLELERNKLKIFSDVANARLRDEKIQLRWTENELEREKERFVLKLLEATNSLRNVRVDQAKDCNRKTEETFVGLLSATRSSVDSCNELMQDVKELRTDLRNAEVEHLNAKTRLSVEHDSRRSRLLEQDADFAKAAAVQRKTKRREAIKRSADECGKRSERFAEYKDRTIGQIVAKNDKDTLHTRRYYEKVLDTNRAVLEDLHAKCKAAKGNLTSCKRQAAALRQEVAGARAEIDANRSARKAVQLKMADSAENREALRAVRAERARKGERAAERRAENLVLDEILAISEREVQLKTGPAAEELLALQLKAVEQTTRLERLAGRLRGRLTRLDQLIGFAAAAKRETGGAGGRMSCRRATRAALRSLAEDAARELAEMRRASAMDHLNAQ